MGRQIGILTGGGDVPGLNSVIKSVTYRSAEQGIGVTGIRRGWEGLTHVNLEDPASRKKYILPLNRETTRDIEHVGVRTERARNVAAGSSVWVLSSISVVSGTLKLPGM